jgi:hypothetical protein
MPSAVSTVPCLRMLFRASPRSTKLVAFSSRPVSFSHLRFPSVSFSHLQFPSVSFRHLRFPSVSFSHFQFLQFLPVQFLSVIFNFLQFLSVILNSSSFFQSSSISFSFFQSSSILSVSSSHLQFPSVSSGHPQFPSVVSFLQFSSVSFSSLKDSLFVHWKIFCFSKPETPIFAENPELRYKKISFPGNFIFYAKTPNFQRTSGPSRATLRSPNGRSWGRRLRLKPGEYRSFWVSETENISLNKKSVFKFSSVSCSSFCFL